MTITNVDFLAILKTLDARRVEYIVVGGVCGFLHGAPLSTFDLDIVHARSSANIERLLSALRDLDAHYRGHGEKRIEPNHSHLASTGHQLLTTRFGPLDLLGMVGAGQDYYALLPKSVKVQVGGGVTVQILSLPSLVEVKEATATEKDRAALVILRRTLSEKK